jgi:hypothetical protein
MPYYIPLSIQKNNMHFSAVHLNIIPSVVNIVFNVLMVFNGLLRLHN